MGQTFLAQTDHGTLSGALHHIAACREVGIIPIVGVEAYYRPLRKSRMTRQAWHLVLLAKNLKGWHNLLRLVSTAYAEQSDGGGFYQYPCVDDELLKRHCEGIIATSACFQSWLSQLIKGGDSVAVRDYVQKMKGIFKDDFYLEIMPHDFDEQRTLNIEIASMAYEYSVPIIATNDAHFVYPEWAETQRIARMAATNLSFSKVEKMIEKGQEPPYTAELYPNLYMSSYQEMQNWFDKYHADLSDHIYEPALTNTMALAQSITPFMLDRSVKMPKVTESPDEAEQMLSQWIDEGFQRIVKDYPPEHWNKWSECEYEDRIDFEWQILKEKNAIGYMVMVADIIRWAKARGIRIGLGRGSAAGCLISYLVGITAIDPIPWGLLFERFLNPGRKGMPDIDIDVQSGRRQEVKEYVIEKYGADHVADIITHERFQPKSVLQSLCRVFDVPYVEAQAVTDTIDIRQDDEETTLEELLPLNDKLKGFKSNYPHIWEHALRLEGTVRNIGKHAAGVVITPKPIIEYMALERGKQGDLVTSWSDSADFAVISDNGFQKIDLLGLKGLERHAYACKLIFERTGKWIELNDLGPLRDPYDVEPEVLELFSKGYTVGLFQFGSKGMTTLLRSINPDSAADLSAANALYRPGPMKGGVTWDYAKIKRGEKEQEEWTTMLDSILDETYGLITYQEQVMDIAKLVGGFSPAQADDLRKAMGKLYRIKGGKAAQEYMSQHHALWESGGEENGFQKPTRDMIWNYILGFGSYGFNKSHSASYGLTAYQDAWLKHHYPLEFYASILTYPSGASPAAKADFINGVVREARSRGIKILPPDVNESGLQWVIGTDDDGEEGLRFALTSIKEVGDVAASLIVKNRIDPYESIADVRQRCGSKVNKKIIDAFTESGAFDCFGARDEASAAQIAAWEKDRLKMIIKGAENLGKYAHIIEPNIYSQEEVAEIEDGERVIVGGEIIKIERKKTKNGRDFANVTVAYQMNEWRVKFWENELLIFDELLDEGSIIMVDGVKDAWNGFISVVAKEVESVQVIADEQELREEGII